MHTPDTEYDPDDNFANSAEGGGGVDGEAAAESLIWHLLLLINPDDEESALQQFAAWQEGMVDGAYGGGDGERDDDGDDDGVDPLRVLREVIDWKSGFRVSVDDPAALIDAINELAARFDLHIDWDLDDDEDADALADADVASLISRAFERLRQDGYSLWTWCPRNESDEEVVSGFVVQRFEDPALRQLAEVLGIELRAGSTW